MPWFLLSLRDTPGSDARLKSLVRFDISLLVTPSLRRWMSFYLRIRSRPPLLFDSLWTGPTIRGPNPHLGVGSPFLFSPIFKRYPRPSTPVKDSFPALQSVPLRNLFLASLPGSLFASVSIPQRYARPLLPKHLFPLEGPKTSSFFTYRVGPRIVCLLHIRSVLFFRFLPHRRIYQTKNSSSRVENTDSSHSVYSASPLFPLSE